MSLTLRVEGNCQIHLFLQLFKNKTRAKQGSSKPVVQEVFCKKWLLKIFQKSRENKPKACNFMKKNNLRKF